MGGSASKPKTDYWRPDDSAAACEICERPFTFFRRRHHCRSCGGLFCDDCTKARTLVMGFGNSARTCTMCAIRNAGTSDHGEANTPRAVTPRPPPFRRATEETPVRLRLPATEEGRLAASAPPALDDLGGRRTPRKTSGLGPSGGTPNSKLPSPVARSLILSAARKRALTTFLLATVRQRRVVLPFSIVEIIMAHLGETHFFESYISPAPRGCAITRQRTTVTFGQRPTLDGDETNGREVAVTTPAFAHSVSTLKHCAVVLTPTLPSDSALSFQFQLTVEKTDHFYLEVGLVHQTFLPAAAGGAPAPRKASQLASNGTVGTKAGLVFTGPLESTSGSVRVSMLSSSRIPPVGIALPRGNVLAPDDSTRSVDPVSLLAQRNVAQVSVYWDGPSRAVTFITSEFCPVTAGGRRYPSSTPSTTEGTAVPRTQYDRRTVEMRLPSGVAGKWGIVFSAECDGEAILETL